MMSTPVRAAWLLLGSLLIAACWGGSRDQPVPAGRAAASPEELQRELRRALEDQDPFALRAALAHGADPNAAGPSEMRPLSSAVGRRNISLTRILVKAGAQVNLADPREPFYTPLFYAVWMDDETAVRELLRAGADPNIRANSGRGLTPLGLAATRSASAVELMLVDGGAEIDSWNLWPPGEYQGVEFIPGRAVGRTPLMIAASLGRKGSVSFLIDRGADPALRNERGETAASLTREYVSPIPSILGMLAHPENYGPGRKRR